MLWTNESKTHRALPGDWPPISHSQPQRLSENHRSCSQKWSPKELKAAQPRKLFNAFTFRTIMCHIPHHSNVDCWFMGDVGQFLKWESVTCSPVDSPAYHLCKYHMTCTQGTMLWGAGLQSRHETFQYNEHPLLTYKIGSFPNIKRTKTWAAMCVGREYMGNLCSFCPILLWT